MKRSLFNRFLHPARPGAAAGFSFTLVPLLASAFLAGPASAATSPVAPAVVPPALRPALYRAIAKDAGPAYALDKNGCATLPQSGLKACFDAKGIRFDGVHPLSLHLAAFGRGTQLTPVTVVHPVIKTNRVSYRHGNLSEWWRVLPMGFEQGFTIAHRPAGHGDLVLALTASRQDAGAPITRHSRAGGNPVRTSPSIPLRSEGGKELAWGKLRYGQLVVTDAKGKVVPATLKTSGGHILIAVNDARAVYPLTVDPLVWLKQNTTAPDGTAYDEFGLAVGVDGDTAIVGARHATVGSNQYQGAAYMFTYSDGVWNEAQKLTATDDPDALPYANFGSGIAIRGPTAFISAPSRNYAGYHQGAVYVFTKSEDGTWAQTQVLTEGAACEDSTATGFGGSAAFDSATLVVSGACENNSTGYFFGVAYIFTQTNGIWTETQALQPTDGQDGDSFGTSVAVDGDSALIGDPTAHESDPYNGGGTAQPTVYVFTRSDSGVWNQTQEISGGAEDANGYDFGTSVAMDGTTGLVGDAADLNFAGAVYVLTKSDNIWTITQELLPGQRQNGAHFGASVALSGATAIVGAPFQTMTFPDGSFTQGLAYNFSEPNWSQTTVLYSYSSDNFLTNGFGAAVAIDGRTALVGGSHNTTSNFGEAYFFGQSDLNFALNAPETVGQGENYTTQTIATNNASAASPAVSATIAVPAAASFVSATATQGSCSEAAGLVTCDFGAIDGNAGTATASITLKATGDKGTTILNTAHIANATPPLSAQAATEIGDANQPPVAKNGTLTTKENKAASGTLDATDPDGDPLTFTIVAQPEHGQVKLDDAAKGTFTYTPDNAFVGSDSFHFEANDGQADSNVATVAITVKSDNHPPVAKDDTLTTDENTTGKGVLPATDPDGDRLTFTIVTTSKHGTVTINDSSKGAYSYKPNKDYIGSDSFTFKASDGQADSNVATITITVETGGSHPPIAHDGNLKVLENHTTAGTFPANDPDGDPLRFTVVAQPAHGKVSLHNFGDDSVYEYVPDKDYVGADSFTYKANDGHGDSNVATISVSVVSNGAGAFGGLGLGLLALLGLAVLIRRRR